MKEIGEAMAQNLAAMPFMKKRKSGIGNVCKPKITLNEFCSLFLGVF
jgi:hypothetical protein